MKLMKAILRNWLFKNYKWITRAEVTCIISVAQWENKDKQKIFRILQDIKEQL